MVENMETGYQALRNNIWSSILYDTNTMQDLIENE